MLSVIIWLVLGIVTLLNDDKRILKINFVLTWLMLMIHLIAKYFG